MTRLRPTPDVAWTTADGAAYVAKVPSGPIIVLTGAAAIVWDEIGVDGDVATLTARVAARITNAPPDADGAVMRVVASLREEELLAP